MIRLLISGTDTGVGKTIFCGLLTRRYLEQGLTVRYIKPVQTGFPPDDDAAVVREISGLGPECTETLYTAEPPVAPCFVWDEFPYRETVDRINVVSDCDILLVETAGGLMVPLDGKRKVYELARDCALSVLVVVPNRLGCLNQAQLNQHFLHSQGLAIHGFALNNHFAPDEASGEQNMSMLQILLDRGIRYVFERSLTSG